jgi:hypothetical protein
MTHDTDYFRRRAAEARAAARSKGESVEVAGDRSLIHLLYGGQIQPRLLK